MRRIYICWTTNPDMYTRALSTWPPKRLVGSHGHNCMNWEMLSVEEFQWKQSSKKIIGTYAMNLSNEPKLHHLKRTLGSKRYFKIVKLLFVWSWGVCHLSSLLTYQVFPASQQELSFPLTEPVRNAVHYVKEPVKTILEKKCFASTESIFIITINSIIFPLPMNHYPYF